MRNFCRPLWLGLLLLTVLVPLSATARIAVLRNDSIGVGDEIAFYTRGAEDDVFYTILDVPEDLAEFQVCRLLVWVGPDDFIVVTASVVVVDELDGQAEILWNGGFDAFQIFGSREAFSSIDLSGEGVVGMGRRVRVTIRHAPGFSGPPTLATDTDGITPMRNRMIVFTRQGDWSGWSEDRPEDDRVYPRPQGDWLLRLQIAGLDDRCPDGDAPLVDMGVPPDQGPPTDAAVPDSAAPDVPELDATAPTPDEGVVPPDMQTPDVMEPDVPQSMIDFGPRPGSFAVSRIVPSRGTGTGNLDVVIGGTGFPAGEPVTAYLGTHRLLEAQARSDSTITAIVPAGIPIGTYNLEVERTDGQLAILPEAFRVEGPDMLALTVITPQALAEGDTAEIRFTGAGFDSETRFEVGTALIQDVVVSGPTSARGRLEATLTAGIYDVVARKGEQEATLTEALKVLRPAPKSSDECGCATSDDLGWTPLALLLLGLRRRRR